VTAFLTAHADAIFWIGVLLEVAGQLWLLFATYACDVSLARWTLVFPPLALYLAFRYPEECLKPTIFCVVAGLIIWLGSACSPPQPESKLSIPAILGN
jgi:hypothetical protein